MSILCHKRSPASLSPPPPPNQKKSPSGARSCAKKSWDFQRKGSADEAPAASSVQIGRRTFGGLGGAQEVVRVVQGTHTMYWGLMVLDIFSTVSCRQVAVHNQAFLHFLCVPCDKLRRREAAAGEGQAPSTEHECPPVRWTVSIGSSA